MIDLYEISPVPITPNCAVHGLDLNSSEPVLSFDGGRRYWTLSQTQRPAWDMNKERWSKGQLEKIYGAVEEVKKSYDLSRKKTQDE